MSATLRTMLRRFLTAPLAVLAALYLLFEEILLVRGRALIDLLARIDVVARIEARVAALSPYTALVVFVIPGLVLYPLKLLALWLLARGHMASSVALFAFAEIAGTLALAWLFKLCRPSLMTVPWFRAGYELAMRWRGRLFAYVEVLPAWKAARARVARLRPLMAALAGRFRRLLDGARQRIALFLRS